MGQTDFGVWPVNSSYTEKNGDRVSGNMAKNALIMPKQKSALRAFLPYFGVEKVEL
jgi:hypothetical protein